MLLQEALEALAVRPAGAYVDATYGRGGHSAEILRRLGPEGRLLAIDRDPEAVRDGRERFGGDGRFSIEHGSFAMLAAATTQYGMFGHVDGVLLDLGVSSPQLDDPRRGFSFQQDGPLDMRMDPTSGISAAVWLARAREEEIAEVLRDYGEERHGARIARAIVAARRQGPIATSRRLAEIIASANPAWEPGKHPATRSFQGIRIFVNRELEELSLCLDQVVDVLAPQGRLVVISFHSLEDRIVKRFIREQARGDRFPRGLPVTADRLRSRLAPRGKAVRPSAPEVVRNPRSRSAVLRAAERLP